MNVMATRENFTGKRSAGAISGTMPDSYGAVFAGFGLCGASRVEAANDTPTNSATSTIIARIGRYWTTSPPPFGRRLPRAIHRASTDAAAPRARARRHVAALP